MAEQVTVWTAESILAFLEAHLETLRSFGVLKLGLFGSYARGEQGAGSDMDFLVRMATPSFDRYMHLKFFLEDHFGCKVDLGEEEYLREEIRPYVM